MERRPPAGYKSAGDEARLFFAFHLLGEWRVHAAAPAMARVLAGGEAALHSRFGDCLFETVPRVLASAIGEDPLPLHELCLDRHADQFMRAVGFNALSIAVGHGRLDRARFVAFPGDAYYKQPKRENSYAWSGWLGAITLLGLEELRPLAMTVFERRYIGPMDFAKDGFETEFARHRANAGGALAGGQERYRLWTDTLGELSTWLNAAEEPEPSPDRAPPYVAPPPPIEQRERAEPPPDFGRVGRNAPCPCGSGQKYKRCHGRHAGG